MSEQSRDTLSRWWWPGQWLHIVYAAWFDQLWFWRNVRQRLGWHPRAWAIFGQAVLGAALASALAMAPLVWVLGATGMGACRPAALLGAGLGLGLAVVTGVVLACARGVADGVVNCAAFGPAYAVASGLGIATIPGGGWDVLAARSLPLAALWGAALGLSAGWGRGIRRGLTSGTRLHAWEIVIDALLFGVLIIGPAAHSMAVYLACTALVAVAGMGGIWLGGIWSTRQVADEEVRRRLANPEVQAPESRAEPRE